MKCIKFENKFYIYQYLFAVVDYNHDILYSHAPLLVRTFRCCVYVISWNASNLRINLIFISIY